MLNSIRLFYSSNLLFSKATHASLISVARQGTRSVRHARLCLPAGGSCSFRFILISFLIIVFLQVAHAKKKPNIIVMVIDDAGYADFGFMGCEDLKTPNIDQLAYKGVIFTDAHSASTVGGPARAALLTGRYPQRFGAECNPSMDFEGFDFREVTLAQVLKKSGYTTGAFGKWYLGASAKGVPNSRGFDYFYGFLAQSRSYFYEPEKDDKKGDLRNILENKTPQSFSGHLTDKLGNQAVKFIETNQKKPFFMYWAPLAVHTPLLADQRDLERFKGEPRQELAAITWALDRAVGRITRKLEELELLENTLIFFVSDNGADPSSISSNGKLKGFKGTNYEGGNRIVMAMSWPKGFEGEKDFTELTSLIDIYTTCLDAVGAKAPKDTEIDGVSLLPFLTGEQNGKPHETLFWRKDQVAAIRKGDYKLIHYWKLGSRMYNLVEDPGEEYDLVTEMPDKYKELLDELDTWEAKMEKPLWTEGTEWQKVNRYVHTDLFDNKPVRIFEPKDLDKIEKK